MVGQEGFEPSTPRLSSVCSNQLSYWPGSRLGPAINAKDQGVYCVALSQSVDPDTLSKSASEREPAGLLRTTRERQQKSLENGCSKRLG